MARPFRVEYENAIYHITSRGNERKELYLDDDDKEHFIGLLNEGADFFRVDIISYCLMPNHYHLLIKTQKANLSRFMQRLNVSYTRYINVKYKRVGHLFQGRYKAIVVGSDEYFLTLSRYIHLNPVKTKNNVNRSKSEQLRLLNEYKWSSYPSVLNPLKRSKYIKCEVVLEYTGGDTVEGRKKYEEYVMSGLGKQNATPFDQMKHQLILGSESFAEWIKETFIKGKDLKPYTHLRELKSIGEVQEIAAVVSGHYGIKKEEILKPRTKHTEARQVMIELCYQSHLWRKQLSELAKELGFSGVSGITMMHSRVQEKLKSDNDLVKKLEKLKDVLCMVKT